MIQLGTHPLPDHLLKEIGAAITTWAAIEQTILMDATQLTNFKKRYKQVEVMRMEFTRLRKKWFKIKKEAIDQKFHSELESINERLAKTALRRHYIVHGVWEVAQDKECDWVVASKGGKDFVAFLFDQRDSFMERVMVPVNFSDFQEYNQGLSSLRLDLIRFLSSVKFKRNLGDSFFEQ